MNPFFLFVLLILGLPTLELYLLMSVGGEIGAVPTVALVVFTAVLGAALVRRQGLQTVLRVRQTLDRGELPALELAEGALLLLAGLLLLIPGFLTDALGFVLLVPPAAGLDSGRGSAAGSGARRRCRGAVRGGEGHRGGIQAP